MRHKNEFKPIKRVKNETWVTFSQYYYSLRKKEDTLTTKIHPFRHAISDHEKCSIFAHSGIKWPEKK